MNLAGLIEDETEFRQQQADGQYGSDHSRSNRAQPLQLSFINQTDQTSFQLDAQGIQRVLNNLLDNASRFACSQVQVRLSRHGHWYQLSIEDDGPGIPQDQREQVLKPFSQLDNQARTPASGSAQESADHAATGRTPSGYGLGLAICQQIARWHQGELLISDSDLGGAALCFRWPVSEKTHTQNPAVLNNQKPEV